MRLVDIIVILVMALLIVSVAAIAGVVLAAPDYKLLQIQSAPEESEEEKPDYTKVICRPLGLMFTPKGMQKALLCLEPPLDPLLGLPPLIEIPPNAESKPSHSI